MVSVLINNHNYGRFIGEAIESVIKQTYQDFELIIVDGDSNDNSREVIMEYVNRYPNKITAVFKPTSGQAAAFNVGFALSKGDIIAFLDSDDYWYENKLEKIVEYHKQYNILGHAKERTDGFHEIVYMDNYQMRPELFRKYGVSHTYFITTSCFSAKREFLEKILPMPEEEFVTCADHYLKLMALYYDNLMFVEDKLSYYRLHGNNELSSNENLRDIFKFEERSQMLDLLAIKKINEKLLAEGQELVAYPTVNLFKAGLKILNDGYEVVNGEKYVLYGTGSKALKMKAYIEFYGGKIIYACDSNRAKAGLTWEGLKIISPDELIKKRSEYDKVIIGSSFYDEIENVLKKLKLKKNKDYMYAKIMPYCLGYGKKKEEN